MRRTILYYPNIEIPDGKWLRNALLYWDEVSSIVPRSVEDNLFSHNYMIAQLRDEGEYRAIYPDQLMYNEVFRDFEEECLKKIKWYFKAADKSRYKATHSTEPRNRIHNEKLVNNYFIHREKISYRIMETLQENGVISTNGDWMDFDNQLANIYMSTLAKYSALSDANNTVIGTDQLSAINRVYPISYASKKPMKYKTPVANLSLNVLPTPSSEVPFSKILKFKRKYRDELLSFRNHINNFEKELSNCESTDELKEKSIIFKERIETGTRETIRMLRGSKIEFVLSSLKSVINLKSPTMIATYAALAGQKLTDIHPATTITGIGIAGAVDISVNYMAINKATKEKLLDKGFLYLYYANRKGIINDFL